MPEDTEDHVATMFHGLISDLQRNDVARFEEDQKKQAELRAKLRQENPERGLSTGELLKKIDGDPEDANRKMQADLARIDQESKTAAAVKAKVEPMPDGHFPPPPSSE